MRKSKNKKTKTCRHEWVVFSTALQDVCLLVECVKCGLFGTVDDPTEEEWSEAFDAAENPYLWTDQSRVTVRGVPAIRHVVKNPDISDSENTLG